MIVYDPLHREVAQAPTSPRPYLKTLLGSRGVVWGSFGSDWLVVVRPTRAGSRADPHPSPTEAPGLRWLGVWANAQQGRAVGDLWLLIPPPSLGGLGHLG